MGKILVAMAAAAISKFVNDQRKYKTEESNRIFVKIFSNTMGKFKLYEEEVQQSHLKKLVTGTSNCSYTNVYKNNPIKKFKLH